MRSGRNDKERSAWRGKFAAPAKAPPMGYDELRKLYLARLRPVIAEAGLRQAMPPRPWFSFVWLERDMHRDPDNVRAGGTKLILDALVLGGVLPGDGAAVIYGFAGDDFEYRGREGVGVAVRDHEGEPACGFTIPFRLPDLNELIAAARQDGILTERTRQARRGRP